MDTQSIVEIEQKKVNHFAHKYYRPFIKDYVAVFVAHQYCQFDFIDENLFNDIADNSLKHLKSVVRPSYDF